MSGFNNIPESVLCALDSFFTDGRCPHAVLIDGGSEPQRDTLSRLASKMIVCSNKDRTPCGACENCRKAEENIHPDIIVVKKPDDKKSFVKADVKKVVGDAYLTPNEADKKVYIISEIQNMNEESQNLLLKILEEPPAYTTFVLTSQNANSVIGTVLSRVVRLRLGKTAENKYSEKAIETVGELCSAVSSPYEFEKVKAIAPLEGNKVLTAEVLSLFICVLRDAIAIKSQGSPIIDYMNVHSKSLAQKQSLKKLLDVYDSVSAIYQSLENNPNYTLLNAVLCARI